MGAIRGQHDKLMRARALKHARMLLDDSRHIDIRGIAKETGWSKSTVQLDLERVHEYDAELYQRVTARLASNRTRGCSNGGKVRASRGK